MPPVAKIYSLDSAHNLSSVRTAAELVGGARPWRFFIPVAPPGAAAGAPSDLVAFSSAGPSYFQNDGRGTFALQGGWNPGGSVPQNVAALSLGRNCIAGRFSDGSLIDLLVQHRPNELHLWQITAAGFERLPMAFPSNFPWDPGHSGLERMAAGKFFEGWPYDGLLFYQGNFDQRGMTATWQLLQLGASTTKRYRDGRATWSDFIPCDFPGEPMTHLLMFDDGAAFRNQRGRKFGGRRRRFPSEGPNPTSPFAELRRPRKGHLVLVDLDPQPDPATGPPIGVTSSGQRIPNRQVVAAGAPFRMNASPIYNMVKTTASLMEPDNIDWWNGGRERNYDCRLLFFSSPAVSGNFIQFFCRHKTAFADLTRYRVLDRNLKIVSGANPINFPEDPGHPSQLPDLILPGNFSGSAGPEFLFYWPA